MTVVFQASADEPIASRLEQWRHVVDETFGPALLRPPSRAHVPERLVAGDVGAVRVSELRIAYPTMSSDRCQAARTPRLIRQSDPEPERYRVDLLVRGQMAVEQAGREAALEPGDFTVVDWSRPARWATASERAVSLMFPQALLALPHDEVARLDREDEVAADTVQDALRRRVHAFIEQRLADPALSPAVIADAHHVSVRYLYKLFEGRHRGVAGWIRSRRLERSRRDLLDPALAARPVSAIAARWGWSTRPSSAASSGRPTAPRRWSTEGPWAGRPAPARCPCTDRQRPCARCQRPPQVPRRHWDRCHRSQGGAP